MFLFFHIMTELLFVFLMVIGWRWNGILNQFQFLFPWKLSVLNIFFKYLSAIYGSSFKKCLFSILAHLFTGQFKFYPVSFTVIYTFYTKDLITFASHTGKTRLMSKTICLSSLHASLTSKGICIKSQSGLNASMPEEVHQYLRNWKAHSAPGTMDSYLKNLCHISLKAATLDKHHGSLLFPESGNLYHALKTKALISHKPQEDI